MCFGFVNIPLKATVSLRLPPLYLELLECGWGFIVLPLNLTGPEHCCQLPRAYALTFQSFCQQAKDGGQFLKRSLCSVIRLTQGWAEWGCSTTGSLGCRYLDGKM